MIGQGSDPFGLLGQTLDGRYRLDAVAGEGGFGVVYQAHHLAFERGVAIKCLKFPPLLSEATRHEVVARFKQEGRLLMSLADCPGVVRVHDLGAVRVQGVEVPYLVMEWLEGATLESFLARRAALGEGALAPDEAMAMVRPIVEALASVHRAGFAHRDIKPANLFVTRASAGGAALKLLDFGVAKHMHEGAARVGASGTSSGFHAFSPAYGAPEQFHARRFGETGPWTDVHALGLVLVELLAGRRALAGDEYADLLMAATSPDRPTPRALGVEVPEAIEQLCAAMLALQPRQRPRSAVEVAATLGIHVAERPHFSVGRDTSPPPHDEAPIALALSATAPAPPTDEPPRGSSSRASSAPVAGDSGSAPGLHDAHLAASIAASLARTEVPDGAIDRLEVRPTVPGPRAHRIGAGVVGVLCVAGAVFAWAAARPRGVEPARDQVFPDGIRFFRGFDARAVERGGERELGRDEARGTHHVEAVYRGGRLVETRAITPSGKVGERTKVTRDAGAVRLDRIDARGVVARVETLQVSGTAGVASEKGTGAQGEVLVRARARDGATRVEGCAELRLTLDVRGQVAGRLCLGVDGQPQLDDGGCVARRFDRAGDGLVVTESCFDEAGATARFATNEHRSVNEYDERGFVVLSRALDDRGAPTRWSSGCARRSMSRDGAGNVVAQVCLDAEGNRIAHADGTPALVALKNDENGCLVERRWRDAHDAPALDAAGRAAVVRRADDACAPVHVENVGRDGSPIAAGGEPPIVDWLRNPEGLVVEQRCLGSAGPVSCATGRASMRDGSVWRFRHDEAGRRVSTRAFTAEGVAAHISSDEPHERRETYAPDGRRTDEAYFDDRGAPALALGSTHRRSFEHDASGRVVRSRSFAVDGAPVLSSLGCHEHRFAYDRLGRAEALECRGVDGEPRPADDLTWGGVSWPRGASRLVVRRDGPLENVFLGPTGETITRVACASSRCYR